VEARW
jgi:Skp family chaperone for outer membrane proteins